MPLVAAFLLLGQAAWKTYPLAGMIVELPKPPLSAATVAGDRTWTVLVDGGVIAVSSTVAADFPPATTLGQFAVGTSVGYDGQIVAQDDLLRNGWPGLRGTVRTKDLKECQFEAYRVGDHLFGVTYLGKDPKIFERITKSIAFASRFGAGKLKVAGPVWAKAEMKPFPYSVELPGTPKADEMRMPQAPNPMRRLTVTYGNRNFSIFCVTLKPEELKTEEIRSKGMADAGTEAVRSSGAKFVKRSASTLDGLVSERVEATLMDGQVTFFTDTTIVDGRMVMLSVVIPTGLKDSPEVTRFFASVKLK